MQIKEMMVMEDKMEIDTEGILDKAAARRLFVAVIITSFIGPGVPGASLSLHL